MAWFGWFGSVLAGFVTFVWFALFTCCGLVLWCFLLGGCVGFWDLLGSGFSLCVCVAIAFDWFAIAVYNCVTLRWVSGVLAVRSVLWFLVMVWVCGFGVSILVCWPGSGFLLYVVLVGLLVGAA